MRTIRAVGLLAVSWLGCSSEHTPESPGTMQDGGAAQDSGGSAQEDSSVGPMVGPPYNECSVDADCGWGEIDHEILKAKDCVCLFGCPYLPLSKSTIERRAQQYKSLCDPERGGDGLPCAIDDCIMPPPLVCRAGVCTAADAGAGF